MPPERPGDTTARLATGRLAISNHGLRASGGIERYGLTIVGGLHRRGVRPTLIAKAFDPDLPEYGWVEPVRADVRAAPGKLRDLFFDWRIGRIKRRLGLFPLIGCNQTRWSDIAICGGTHPGFRAAMGGTPGWIDRLKTRLERVHFEQALAIVAHSKRMIDELRQHYQVDAARIELLYPPVDGERFSTVGDDERRRLRQELGFDHERAVFLLASTGHKRKGLAALAAAFARTALPATLVVAGRPPDAGLANVRYLGYRSDIENIYRAVDFTVMASTYEPFGLVGVESVLCGTPVLLDRRAGCAEVIVEPAQLPFAADDPATLDAAMAAGVERWRHGLHRLAAPRQLLAYDPAVLVHVDALLAIAERVLADRAGPSAVQGIRPAR